MTFKHVSHLKKKKKKSEREYVGLGGEKEQLQRTETEILFGIYVM